MWVDLSAEWSDGSGFFTAFRMTEGRGDCHSEERSDEESKAVLGCCACILTNETHGLYIEPENPGSIDLSAERSDGSGFFTPFRMTEGARRLSF